MYADDADCGQYREKGRLQEKQNCTKKYVVAAVAVEVMGHGRVCGAHECGAHVGIQIKWITDVPL
jgi:hypothetical protein